MTGWFRDAWQFECQLEMVSGAFNPAPTWTQVVEWNMDWYTNSDKWSQPFNPIGWDTTLPARFARGREK